LRARRETAVRPVSPIGEGFAPARDALACSGLGDGKPGLADDTRLEAPSHRQESFGGGRVGLAAVVESTVWLDETDLHDRAQGADLECDQPTDVGRRQTDLGAPEIRAVVVARMRHDLDAELPAALCGLDGKSRRAGM
jgi:hypothetical protein